ncbi:hypothetical protein GCM10025867_42850 [Frondihabitans sucicola]|uniref:DUF1700 domain-containing protein n=1 Tax=Frondihabitans sucicola TaxID=1268041 RepID=A0ABN6Y4N2_9MICO|nr:hypothetical protein [Frondihabitans sucicola]BDZ52044.1 hypothetical protein GCM10025867_42850 [Frondihabitans sucicola]
MTDTTPKNVTDYLARLQTELADVPPEVSTDIVAGIREELQGLDQTESEARIATLGDPAFIAAEARAASPTPVSETTAPGRTLSIAAVLVLILGSIVVPGVGALVGLVWVSIARAWSRTEKLVAWLVPIAVAIVVIVVLLILAASDHSANGSHLSFLLAYLVFPIEGIVLAVRARGRGWRARA